jgi:hypothetical protein
VGFDEFGDQGFLYLGVLQVDGRSGLVKISGGKILSLILSSIIDAPVKYAKVLVFSA